MKTFILKFLIFLLPIVLISYEADIFISKRLKKSNSFADGEYPTWNDLYDGKINSEIIISGSSNALIEIDPTLISKQMNSSAYNLGINGHNFRLQYFRHQLLLKYNLKPKLIIQTISSTIFEKQYDVYNLDQFLPYMLNNKELEDVTMKFNGYNNIDFKLPLIRYYGKKEAILNAFFLLMKPSSNHLLRTKGYRTKDIQWNNDFENVQKKMKSLEIQLDSSLISLFEDYINECKQDDIKLIIVNPPEFIDGQQFVKNRSEIMSLFYQFSKRYAIPFFDYSKDSISFQKKYFYNSGHLNKTGAELFTNKLIIDLKKIQMPIL